MLPSEPRLAVPERYHLPLGISLSREIGYQRALFSADTWTWEIRPIVDKKLGRWYSAFNPSLKRAFHGPDTRRGLEFSLNFKVSYDIAPKVAAGLEYYGALGPVTGFDPQRDQEQQMVPAIDLNLNPKWGFQFWRGRGRGRHTRHGSPAGKDDLGLSTQPLGVRVEPRMDTIMRGGMPGKFLLDRLRESIAQLRERIEIFISGRPAADPLYLTNRTWLQKLKLGSLIAAPVLLLIILGTIGAANRLRVDKVDPYEHPAVEAAPAAEAPPPPATQKPLPDAISASTELEVVNMRIARDARPPMVTGMVRNKTDRKVESAEVSYYLSDAAGSLVGTDKTEVANVEPHGSVAFRMPLKAAKAEYVFVRDVHPD